MTQLTTKTRPPPSNPIHHLLDHLRELQIRMSNLGGNPAGMNVIEAYDYFIRESDSGRNCPMALKAQKVFFSEDYQDIKEQLKRLLLDLEASER